ncbi:hypothetical protein CLAVI_000927 [Candidatus Clavichlamydia salmonicola]|uniref:hypothetical protein n=1 Tax=Candidatus Clavichlamydia salmonicola TaxID=469812 RepID=UPI0018910945|nr:hypothetical protein [Candidatus Clavichlamydia salmonicola]MBF5051286.1 hypothetical protein [Candidatus Clavichlamydia salmonicola]
MISKCINKHNAGVFACDLVLGVVASPVIGLVALLVSIALLIINCVGKFVHLLCGGKSRCKFIGLNVTKSFKQLGVFMLCALARLLIFPFLCIIGFQIHDAGLLTKAGLWRAKSECIPFV